MSQIKTCYLRDSEGCDLESCSDCGYYKLVVESANSLQQLKAEIAKEAVSLELNYGDTSVVRMIAEHLRQLSAV